MKRNKLSSICALIVIAALCAVSPRPAHATIDATLELSVTCDAVTLRSATLDTTPVTVTLIVNQGSTRLVGATHSGVGAFSFYNTFSRPVADGTLLDVHVSDSTGDHADTQIVASCRFDGPFIPANFVLRTVTCSVSLFDAPNGHPVANARITSGQTWYIDPLPYPDENGKNWTDIYVSDANATYIPTSCIGDPPVK